MRRQLLPKSDVLAYCLMPNHFHWLLYVKKADNNKKSQSFRTTGQRRHPLITKIAILLSSYTQAINNQQNRSGSLFRQKTKAVEIDSLRYGLTCFHYIHQNPLRAGLVKNLSKWEFSSFKDYVGFRNGTLINKERTEKMLAIRLDSFIKDSYRALDAEVIAMLE